MRTVHLPPHTDTVRIASGTSDLAYVLPEGARAVIVVPATGPGARTIDVRLAGRGSSALILGYVALSGSSAFELHTSQHHQAPDTTSDLLVKSVLSGKAALSYTGTIRVDKAAQKTDAYQRNENLLLSPDAQCHTSPALEILANDVRCTHGATVSSVSQDELWYLATRGIGREMAEALIVSGFMQALFDRIADGVRRREVLSRMRRTLPSFTV